MPESFKTMRAKVTKYAVAEYLAEGVLNEAAEAADWVKCHSVPDCRQVAQMSAQIALLTDWCRYVTAYVDWTHIPKNPAFSGGGGGAPPPPPKWP